jgi:Protein of unknown function (DUF3800)
MSRQASRLGALCPKAQSLFLCAGIYWKTPMFLCYVDESGTSDLPGTTSHFVLAGFSIPIWRWKRCDIAIEKIKRPYALQNAEIHVAWLLRKYIEQKQIPNFETLPYERRRSEVERIRRQELYRLQKSNQKSYRQTKKNYKQTESYVHLTLEERKEFVLKVAECVGSWGYARLFADCIDKIHFDPSRNRNAVDEEALEQVVSRFQQYLTKAPSRLYYQSPGREVYRPIDNLGLLIHDNNETVARKHTELMRSFHEKGTFWTQISNIIETPLFVDSRLTSMVQIADLCAYGLRRYLENNETDIFDRVFLRADRRNSITVGIRHFTKPTCNCAICTAHRLQPGSVTPPST